MISRADSTLQLANLVTEARNPRSDHIDELPTLEMLGLINAEDARVAEAVRAELPHIAMAVDAIAERFTRGGRLFYIGAGTSGRLGVLDASECPPTFSVDPGLVQGLIAGGDRALRLSSEHSEDSPEEGARDLAAVGLRPEDAVVGIAASGRTPYVLGALAYARDPGGLVQMLQTGTRAASRRSARSPEASQAREASASSSAAAAGNSARAPSATTEQTSAGGALTIALTCVPASPLAQAAEIAIMPVVGPEVLTGSTRMKAGTATKLVLNMLSTAVMIRTGATLGNLMVNVRATNAKLQDRARRIVVAATNCTGDRAEALLRESGGDVKTAILMQQLGLAYGAASARLKRTGGNLREALRR